MANGVFSKILNIMGLEDDIIDEEEEFNGTYEEETAYEQPKKKAKVVNIHSAAYAKIMLCQPYSYDDAQTVIDHLKNRRPVVLNLEALDGAMAQRILDFTSGAAYALDGNVQKVSKSIFIVVPSNIELSGNILNSTEDDSFYTSFFDSNDNIGGHR
jgi:cell division inhibitor SepF